METLGKSRQMVKRSINPLHVGLTVLQRRFLKAFAKTGNLSRAARIAKCHRSTHCDVWMKQPEYRTAFIEAENEAGETLEKEAYRRAVDGVDKPVFGSLGRGMGSGEIGVVREYSDTLLIFLMKGRMPHKYRENRSLTIDGKVEQRHTGTVNVNMNFEAFAKMSDTDLDKYIEATSCGETGEGVPQLTTDAGNTTPMDSTSAILETNPIPETELP